VVDVSAMAFFALSGAIKAQDTASVGDARSADATTPTASPGSATRAGGDPQVADVTEETWRKAVDLDDHSRSIGRKWLPPKRKGNGQGCPKLASPPRGWVDKNYSKGEQKVTQPEKLEVPTSSLIWINCPYPAVTFGLERALEAKTRVHSSQEPPVDEAPSAIIFFPSNEDVGSEVKCLRDLAPDASILVLGLHADKELARSALLAGAQGFIHFGMRCTQITCALAAASKGETLVPRDLLEALLVERVSRVDLDFLTPRQLEFLELVVAEATTTKDEIVVPRELFEAFLREGGAAVR
jgi:hypothetical protein